ncbi:hypothetical protein SAMN04489761_3589 [Tenacibaculum sp. MAR_2009_124]|nr:hypothetical protein SAMN04489761_3589 [Tenacibaculum sp. MAR_2009_124]
MLSARIRLVKLKVFKSTLVNYLIVKEQLELIQT